MGGDKILHLGTDNWQQEVLKSPIPVLVDFWAPWCGPCRAIAPVLDELSEELDGKLKIGKVNVDDHQELAAKFEIRSIPTMLIFQNGVVQQQIVGAMNKAALKDKLMKHLA